MVKHYCYGSGTHGCLYDNGPNFCEKKEQAIDSLMWLFHDELEEGEPARMRANLETSEYHKFENPGQAGADYCNMTECDGACPEDSE